jgi:hypothetical protein
MRAQASLIPNPSLYASSENTPIGGSQPFPFGNDTDDYVYLSAYGKGAADPELLIDDLIALLLSSA